MKRNRTITFPMFEDYKPGDEKLVDKITKNLSELGAENIIFVQVGNPIVDTIEIRYLANEETENKIKNAGWTILI